MMELKSLSEACTLGSKLNTMCQVINTIIGLWETHSELFDENSSWFAIPTHPKQAQEFMNYQYVEPHVKRDFCNDRAFPLETVRLQEFQQEHDVDVKQAMIYTGSYADEMARRMNALAITMGRNIYFRNNAYQPESEEGRKLLNHELTHVAQFEEKRITPTTTKEELELEAEIAEGKAVYDDNPYLYIPIEGEVYKIRESELGTFASMTADVIEKMIDEEKSIMSEQDYLLLLCAYESWLKERI